MIYQNIIEKGLKLGFDEIEIYERASESNVVKLFDGNLSNYDAKKQFSATIKGLYQGKMSTIVTESLDDLVVDELLQKLMENVKAITAKEENEIFPKGATYKEIIEPVADYDEYSLTEKIEMLKTLSKKALSVDERIVKVGACQYMENKTSIKIINSKGLDLKKEGSYMFIVLGVVGFNGKDNSVGYAIDASHKFKELDLDKVVKDAVKDAISSLGGEQIKSGSYPIIFTREVASDILSAFSSVFSGDAALRKLTLLVDKEGEKVFGDNITIKDDPFYEKSFSKSSFDDEGVPCQTKYVVKNGKFVGLLHNLKTAKAFNKTSTGNGCRAGRGKMGVSFINMCLEKGTLTEDEMIKTVDFGILVTSVTGLHAGLNPISGDFNVQSSGILIENGVKTKPVTLFVISGNFYEMLNNVEILGSNIPEKVIDSVSTPSLKIKSLQVSGK